MATAKKAVAAVAFNEQATIETMVALDKAQTGAKHAEMVKLSAEFGDAALKPTKLGGLSRNAFKIGATTETMQKAAISASLTLEKAQCLARIIGAINEARPTLWQNYQECYFGLDVVRPTAKAAPTEKTPEQKQFTEAQELKAKLTAQKKAYAEKAKLAGAQALLLGAQGDTAKAKEALDAEKALKAKAKEAGEHIKNCSASMEKIKTAHKDAALYDQMLTMVDKLKARFGAECFDMQLGEIMDALAK